MTTLKTLQVAAALAATVVPTKAQVSGGYAFQMPIFNAAGEAVFSGIPEGRYTKIYDLKGQYVGRVFAKTLFDGNGDRWVVSLLDFHIGCTDIASAEMAAFAPNNADRTKCVLMSPSMPYTVVEKAAKNSGILAGRCLRPLKAEGAPCRWVFLTGEALYTKGN